MPSAIATDYEKAATTIQGEPAAAALYLASAAKMAQLSGDAARGKKLLDDAKAQLAKAAIVQRLPMALKGDALSAELVAQLKTASVGPGLDVKADKGDVTVELQSSAVTVSTSDEDVVLKAEVQEQKGTQINREWSEKNKDCERAKDQLESDKDSCNRHNDSRNGFRNHRCGNIAGHQKDWNSCLERLAKIKKESPAFVTVELGTLG